MYETESSRWQAIQQRDQAASSSFIYAVLSTKIYCRPGCPSRLARRANVCFYNTTEDAVRDGYRPCLRCKPDQPSFNLNGQQVQQDIVRRACSFIAESKGEAKFADVAKKVGLSTRYLYGLFKTVTGITPAKYAVALKFNNGAQDLSVTPAAMSAATSPAADIVIGDASDAINWSALFDFNYSDFTTMHESTDWPLRYDCIDEDTLAATNASDERGAADAFMPTLDFSGPVLSLDGV